MASKTRRIKKMPIGGIISAVAGLGSKTSTSMTNAAQSSSNINPDGTYKNKLVQNGVYVWKLSFSDINGKDHTKIGHVTIVK